MHHHTTDVLGHRGSVAGDAGEQVLVGAWIGDTAVTPVALELIHGLGLVAPHDRSLRSATRIDVLMPTASRAYLPSNAPSSAHTQRW